MIWRTVSGVTRHCSRPQCSAEAAVTLTYSYGTAQAWLDVLSAQREPHLYDLCDRHAERLSVPSGWELVDRRRPVMHWRMAG